MSPCGHPRARPSIPKDVRASINFREERATTPRVRRAPHGSPGWPVGRVRPAEPWGQELLKARTGAVGVAGRVEGGEQENCDPVCS